MRESRLYGSVRGALGDRRPYRDTDLWGAWRVTAGSTRKSYEECAIGRCTRVSY